MSAHPSAALMALAEGFRAARRAGDYADVSLCCEDGVVIQAHSIILCLVSPVLKAALTGSFAVATPRSVDLRDLKADALSFAMDFCCGEGVVDGENAVELLQLADKLQMEPLRLACEQALRENLTSTTAQQVAKTAAAFGCPTLATEAEELLSESSTSLSLLLTRKRRLEAKAAHAEESAKRLSSEAEAVRKEVRDIDSEHTRESERVFQSMQAASARASGASSASATSSCAGRVLIVRRNSSSRTFPIEGVPGVYPSVFEAVAAARPGDVLKLERGNHYLESRADKSCHLGAFGKSLTVMAADGLSPEEVSLTGPVMGDNAGLVVVIGSAHLKLVGVSIVPVPEDDYCKRTEALEVTSQCSLTLERCRVSGGSFVFPKASLTAVDTQFTKAEAATVLADATSVGVTLTRCLVSGGSSGRDHFQWGFLPGECGAIEVRDEELTLNGLPAVRVVLTECTFDGNYGCAVAYRLDDDNNKQEPLHAAFRQAFDLQGNHFRRNRIAFKDSAVDEEGRDLPLQYRGVVANTGPQGTNRTSALFASLAM